jgi:hypothetical protein
MPRGGKRPGAGRKPKPLAENILDGNPGKRKMKVLDFKHPSKPGDDFADTPEYLSAFSKTGPIQVGLSRELFDSLPGADAIYRDVSEWLKRVSCINLISPLLVSQYALLMERWLECEAHVSTAMLKMLEDDSAPSDYVGMAKDYQKMANDKWTQIWAVVAANSTKNYSNDNPHDEMAGLLNRRRA